MKDAAAVGYEGSPATLQWTDDDRIQLVVQPADAPSAHTVFDAAAAGLDVAASQALLTLSAEGQQVTVDFAPTSGAVGFVPVSRAARASGIDRWMTALTAAGARGRRGGLSGFGWRTFAPLLGAMGLIALFIWRVVLAAHGG